MNRWICEVCRDAAERVPTPVLIGFLVALWLTFAVGAVISRKFL